MSAEQTATKEEILYGERLGRMEDAIALKEPDRIPLAPAFSGVIQNFYGSSYRSLFYDHDKALDAIISFYKDYPQCDTAFGCFLMSGKSLELSGLTFFDWPGRPGTVISDYSTHQILEKPYMTEDEYPELLNDYTGFMLRKFTPRLFANIKGFENVNINPMNIMGGGLLGALLNPEMEQTYKQLIEIGKLEAGASAKTVEASQKLAAIGMPSMFMGMCMAPYDILGDNFRGTLGIMEDLLEREDEIDAVCEMFAQQQIQALQYLRHIPLPGRRVFFPLHKGMDGFMNPKQYEKLYWKPLKKIMMALIDMGVTPYIYTEGKYDTRMQLLTDVPKGKVLYHFEDVDMKEAKRLFTGVACIMGNLPVSVVEFGKKEAVEDYCKYLIDTCGPGGGYIFDFNGSLENAPRENVDAIFKVFETYR